MVGDWRLASVASTPVKRFLTLLLASTLTISVAGCSSGGISASTCDEVVGETIDLYQDLIDFVDDTLQDVTIEEFVAMEGDLPSLDAFGQDADAIDEIAADLGCTQTEISSAVDARLGELTSTTELGQFIINAFRSGGI